MISKENLEKLSNIQSQLIDLIAATDNQELMDKFLEYQEQKNVCNQELADKLDKELEEALKEKR